LNASLNRNPLRRLAGARRILVVTHRNADVDAVASAVALKRLASASGPGKRITLVSPEGVTLQSRKVLSVLKATFLEEIPNQRYDLVIITDTGHSSLLSAQTEVIKSIDAYKVLIDHHPPDESMKGIVDSAVIDIKASSASELVFRLAEGAAIRVTREAAKALLLGIMADSQFLTIASNGTISSVDRLCVLGGDVEKSRSMLRTRRDVSESIARIKASRRATYYRAGEWLAAVTTVGSFQASVARALVDVGADVSLALGEVGDETRASLRSTQIFKEKTGIHLGTDFCKAFSDRLGGAGGGHPTAASMNVPARPEVIIQAFKETLAAKLDLQLKELS
jgi:nanoRNase/pAp phosphatase (c-di-AMP/oligoRNAs hydrolase)